MEEQQHQNVLSKGLHEEIGKKTKNNTNVVFENEIEEKTPKKPRASEGFWRKRFQGKATARKLMQIASRRLTLFGRGFSARGHSESQNRTLPQAFRAAFPHKTGNGLKLKRPKKSKLVTAPFLLNPQVVKNSAFEQT